jgi:hypothetical protein
MAVELEFRDGIAPVANHVAWLLRGVDTTTMTKEQAIRASETQMVKDYLNSAQRKVMARHFREDGRW